MRSLKFDGGGFHYIRPYPVALFSIYRIAAMNLESKAGFLMVYEFWEGLVMHLARRPTFFISFNKIFCGTTIESIAAQN